MILYLQEYWRQLQDPHTAHYSQIEHSRWFPYDSPSNDSFTLEDSRIQIPPQFCNLQQTSRYRDYFGIDIQKKFSLSYAWDKETNCYIQRDSKFLTYMQNCEQ